MEPCTSALDKVRNPYWWVPVRLNKVLECDGIVDTGAWDTVIPHEIAKRLGVVYPVQQAREPIHRSGFGDSPTIFVPVDLHIIGMTRSATIDVRALRLKLPKFDFVILGLDFLDEVEATLVFGKARGISPNPKKRPLDMTTFGPVQVLYPKSREDSCR